MEAHPASQQNYIARYRLAQTMAKLADMLPPVEPRQSLKSYLRSNTAIALVLR